MTRRLIRRRLFVVVACAFGLMGCSQQPSTIQPAEGRPTLAERQAFISMAQVSLQRLRSQADSIDHRRRVLSGPAAVAASSDVSHRRAVLDTLEQQLLAVTTADDATYGALCQIFLTYRHRHTSFRSKTPPQGSLARMAP